MAIFEEAEKLAHGDFDSQRGRQWDLHRARNGLILSGTMLGNKEVVKKAATYL